MEDEKARTTLLEAEAKLNAKNFQDLEEVVKLAEKAVDAGLDDGGKEFAIQLMDLQKSRSKKKGPVFFFFSKCNMFQI